MNISGNIPSVGGNEDPVDKEAAAEEEKLRQEAIKEAEEKRRKKHKNLEEERENMRQGIRDRVSFLATGKGWLALEISNLFVRLLSSLLIFKDVHYVKAMKSSPLLGPFCGSEFQGFSLLKI